MQYENSTLAQQLYTAKTQALASTQAPVNPADPLSVIEGKMRDERDQLVELMKRNHDVVVEKYEVQRQRNEGLEKVAAEKEKLYQEIKSEND